MQLVTSTQCVGEFSKIFTKVNGKKQDFSMYDNFYHLLLKISKKVDKKRMKVEKIVLHVGEIIFHWFTNLPIHPSTISQIYGFFVCKCLIPYAAIKIQEVMLHSANLCLFLSSNLDLFVFVLVIILHKKDNF